MLSWQTLYTDAQDMTAGDTSAESLVFLKRNINIGLHTLEASLGSYYTEDTRDIVQSTSGVHQTPDNYVRLKEMYLTISSVQYPITEVFDESLWRTIKAGNASTSNNTQFAFFRRDTFEVYPTPTSAVNSYTLIYESSNKDLSNDDYTTGTITTLANAGTAVTGSGTTWTSAMIGRMFQISAYPIWYEITAVGSATTLTLKKPYQGPAISAGTSAYTIGEFPRTPPATHIIPVHYSLWQYFLGVKKDDEFSSQYKELYQGGPGKEYGVDWAVRTFSKRYSSHYIPNQRNLRRGVNIYNPNAFPTGAT